MGQSTGHAIKAATHADLTDLLEIEKIFPSDRISKRAFRYHIQNPKALFLVWQEKGRVLGYALFFIRQNRLARFYSLAVRPGAQGRGIGRSLCVHSLNFLHNKEINHISLEVDAADHQVIQFYQSLGFKASAMLEGYYEDGRSALRMKQVLKASIR